MKSRHLRLTMSGLLVALGMSVVIGWVFGLAALTSVLPGLSTMKFNTAICLMLIGFGTAGAGAAHQGLRGGGAVAGGLVTAIGALTLFQYLAGVDLRIDQLFVADRGTLRGSGFPGRMSPLTATAFMALGPSIMLLALGRKRATIVVAHILAGYAGFVGFLAAAGYAFGAEAFWGIGFYTAIAVHTAVGLLIAVVAALMTRADEGWMAPFRDSPDARALLAQLLPISIFLPAALGVILMFGSGLGAFNAAFGFAFFAPCMTLALVWVAIRVARRARDAELALRRSEAALLASQDRLIGALTIAQMGTFEWSVDSDEIVMDARSREIFGLSGNDVVQADDLFAHIDPADLQRVLAEFRASRDSLSRLETEYRLLLPDGIVRSIVSFSDVEGEGRAERIFGVVGDISDRKQLEEDLLALNETLEERVRERSIELERVHEQLRQAQKLEAMGQLTGGVAHDFNNLLSPIIGGLDLIRRRGFEGERSERLIEGALASAERARVLVQRLLAFARRQPLQPAAVNIGELLKGMAELVASTSGPRIKVACEVAADLPAARADANQLEMAILNLAVNARDAMPDGGQLTISAGTDQVTGTDERKLSPGRYVMIAVADTGVGMDEATLARCVEPFFSTKGIGRGTGLGLSMVHGLAAQLGGELQIKSKAGIGTAVELWLPLAQGDPGAAARSETIPPAAGSGLLLLVDDEEEVRATTAEMLREIGYSVVASPSAEDAIERISQGLIPNIVVTDHLMPGMTGADFARWMNAVRPALPVLIISGYADVDDLAPDLHRLTKPFRQAELAAALAKAMDAAGNGSGP
ncbi:MAG TPA: ATP-binding protein [Allosphingosinicella sp.]|nr:ATP-binding protein [Allosphingosinicella sp.]